MMSRRLLLRSSSPGGVRPFATRTPPGDGGGSAAARCCRASCSRASRSCWLQSTFAAHSCESGCACFAAASRASCDSRISAALRKVTLRTVEAPLEPGFSRELVPDGDSEAPL